MAEEKKKSKIDLKARLAKTMVGGTTPAAGSSPGAPGGGIPAPSDSNSGSAAAAGSVRPPMGIVPPAGLSPGIPLPPFAQQRQASAPPPKPTAAQQTIKVEVGEEVEAERKKATKKAALYAAITAVVGIAIGYGVGKAAARSDRGAAAVKGAAALEADVKTANEKMTELRDKLSEAATKLQNKEFPDDVVSALGGINIPFDATNLDGKHVGDLPGSVLRSVLNYTSGIDDLNKTKDSIKNLLIQAKGPVTKSWAEAKEPVSNFSVIFRDGGSGKTYAEFVPNKEPFKWKGDFPEKYKITMLQNNKPVEKEVARWQKGSLTASDPLAIPVDPVTTAGFTSDVIVSRLSAALYDLRKKLEGDESMPTAPVVGLIKEGDDLAHNLHKISLAK